MKNRRLIFVTCMFAMYCIPAAAQTAFNDTTGDHLWTNAANWSAGVPDAADAVTQSTSGGADLILNTDAGTVSSFSNGSDTTNTFNIVTGGSLTTSGRFDIGGNVGSAGVGIMNVDGGSLSVGGDMQMGRFGTARRGIITLNSGSILIAGQTQIGGWNAGTGQLNINGGTYTANNKIRVGLAGDGELNLGGGTINAASMDVASGGGDGDVFLNSGTLNVNGGTTIGANGSGGAGSVILSGADFNAGGQMKVGDAGSGTLTLNSGALTTADSLTVAAGAGSGTMVMNGGTLSLTNTWGQGALNVGGGAGNALFELNGGNVSVDSLYINSDGTGTARLEVNDGLLEIRNAWGASLSINNSNAELFIGGGIVTRNLDRITEFTNAVNSGVITWDSSSTTMVTDNWDVSYTNGTGSILYVDYNDANAGQTTMWAVIPEPATLGLVAAVGGALLVVRRIFSL